MLPLTKLPLTVEVITVILRLLLELLVDAFVVMVVILVRVATTSIVSLLVVVVVVWEALLSVVSCGTVTVTFCMLTGVYDANTSTGIVVTPVETETTVACDGHVGHGW